MALKPPEAFVNSFQSVPAFLSAYKALFVTRPPAKVAKNNMEELLKNQNDPILQTVFFQGPTQ
jgi:hypothetical protein